MTPLGDLTAAVWLRLDWWLPFGNSNLFDGPGAWLYFAWRRLVRAAHA